MRIISQDGMIDVPYDLSALSIGYGEPDHKYHIYIRSKLLDERPCIFASYSTEAKAKKAMEMLREAYTRLPIIMQNVDISEDVAEMFEKWKKQGICIQTANNEPSKVECINNGYFQFPADDEVEV